MIILFYILIFISQLTDNQNSYETILQTVVSAHDRFPNREFTADTDNYTRKSSNLQPQGRSWIIKLLQYTYHWKIYDIKIKYKRQNLRKVCIPEKKRRNINFNW